MSARTDALLSQAETGKMPCVHRRRCDRLSPGVCTMTMTQRAFGSQSCRRSPGPPPPPAPPSTRPCAWRGGSGVGGLSACSSRSEFAEAPPTPDPSPPLRGGRGEEDLMRIFARLKIQLSNSKHVSNSKHASRSRRAFFSREVCQSRPFQREGAGNAGRPMRPIAACAMSGRRCTRVSRSHRNHPAFPTQWFYGFLRALPGDRAVLPPSSPRSFCFSRT